MESSSMTGRDTICAISTPAGVGGIAVARVSGPDAVRLVDSIWHGKSLMTVDSHTAHLGTVADSSGQPLDQCVATVYRAPRSFTGDDVVEIAVHGSRYVQRELLNTLIVSGARLAEAGEFTRRAFTAGKMDLAEAEAVADVIASNSRAAHRIALTQMRGGFSRRLAAMRDKLVDLASLLELELDFSEEEVEFASREKLRALAVDLQNEIDRLHRSFVAGSAIKDGIPVAIVGATNAGKSSLLNALLDDDRAIVSDIHGTTRDTIEETLEIGDYLFRFIDTAGLRETEDTIERIGIERSRRAIESARIVIFVADVTETFDLSAVESHDIPHVILALNKTDLLTDMSDCSKPDRLSVETVRISALTGEGIDTLRSLLVSAADADNGTADEDILVTNARHAEALGNASRSIARVIEGLDINLPGDLIAQDLRETIHHLAAITGDIPSAEILAAIFSRFCIGK